MRLKLRCLYTIVLLIVLLFSEYHAEIIIGGIFDTSLVLAQTLEIASKDAKNNLDVTWDLETIIKQSPSDILEAEKAACELIEDGVFMILGPNHSPSYKHVQTICDMVDIPHFLTEMNLHQQQTDSVINVYPHYETIYKAVSELVVLKGWRRFTIIYEDAVGLSKLLEVLHLHTYTDNYDIRMRQLPVSKNFRPLLINIKHSGDVNYLIDCNINTLPNVLEQSQQVGIMTNKHSFIITNLEMNTIDLEPFSYGDANITGLRFYDPNLPEIHTLISRLKEVSVEHVSLDIQKMPLNILLTYDAVQVFSRGFYNISKVYGDTNELFNPSGLTCDGSTTWHHGTTIINYIRSTEVLGLTSTITFDDFGYRKDVLFDVVELNRGGSLIKIGNWTRKDHFIIEREGFNITDDSNKSMEPLVVVTAISHPYGMLKESTVKLKKNEQYEGFGIELIEELGKLMGFNATFIQEKEYGTCNRTSKQCSGMLGKINNGSADFAITDLTITADRESGVDFTTPFMNLGISILYKKPQRQAPELFSFMLPFSTGVWLCVGAAYFLVSFLLYLLGRICPDEWQNPYPCIEEPDVLENQFTIANAMWFNAGALLLQGSEIAPIAYGTRTIASMWWFFVLIITSSYTANLTAFLAVESKNMDFNDVFELADNELGIAYGAKNGGSTFAFFKESENEVFQKMYRFMVAHPEHMTESNDEGLGKVREGKYAYLMESTSIEYITERNCDVMQVGGLLDNKGYGIAMKKDSPYRNLMSEALLQLQEKGVLETLKTKWWKVKRGGGACVENAEAQSDDLGLENVGGVFVVLGVGSVTGILISFADMAMAVYKRARDVKISFKEELIKELKFVFSFSTNEKPVLNQSIRQDSDDTNNSDMLQLRSFTHHDDVDDDIPGIIYNPTTSPRQSIRSRRRSSLHPIHDGHVRLARQFSNNSD